MLAVFIPILLHYINKKSNINVSYDPITSYIKKPQLDKKVIIVIESYETLSDLTKFIHNLLNQTVRVNSIILIQKDHSYLHDIKILKDTCIFSKTGGLSLLFKEKSKDAIILFLFSNFSNFKDPTFLNRYLNYEITTENIVRVNCNDYMIPIQNLYETNNF